MLCSQTCSFLPAIALSYWELSTVVTDGYRMSQIFLSGLAARQRTAVLPPVYRRLHGERTPPSPLPLRRLPSTHLQPPPVYNDKFTAIALLFVYRIETCIGRVKASVRVHRPCGVYVCVYRHLHHARLPMQNVCLSSAGGRIQPVATDM